MIPSEDRFIGCLLGQCLGDALGFVVEGESPEVCAAYAQQVVRARQLPGSGRDGFGVGQYSDESQMARELMLSLTEHRRLDPADFARRIAELFAENRVVGRGHATSAAADRLIAGIAWQDAGTPAPSAGNASAMRAAPIGLFFASDPARQAQEACVQSRITHSDPRCCAGAAAVAAAVALAAASDRIDPTEFLGRLQALTVRIEPTIASGLRQLQDWLTLPEADAARLIAHAGLPPGVDSHWRGGISAFVVASLLWALYAFLRSPEDYLGAVAIAIQPGGDVDTTAALAGALVGAHLGTAALPDEMLGHLTDNGSWTHDALADLARRCRRAAVLALA
jgi:ADP-ribosylglycohydrolase